MKNSGWVAILYAAASVCLAQGPAPAASEVKPPDDKAKAVAEAKAKQNVVRYALADLESRVWLDVKSSYLELENALQQIHQAEETLASSSGQLELADKRYNAGLGNIIELTDAERFYIDDNAAYVDALYACSVAKAKLDRATGASLSTAAR